MNTAEGPCHRASGRHLSAERPGIHGTRRLFRPHGLPHRLLSAAGRRLYFRGHSASGHQGPSSLSGILKGEIPGASPRDCGNYLDMNLNMARYLAKKYLEQVLYAITPGPAGLSAVTPVYRPKISIKKPTEKSLTFCQHGFFCKKKDRGASAGSRPHANF